MDNIKTIKQGKGEAWQIDRLGSGIAFGKEFGFYFLCNGKPLEVLMQGMIIIRLMF